MCEAVRCVYLCKVISVVTLVALAALVVLYALAGIPHEVVRMCVMKHSLRMCVHVVGVAVVFLVKVQDTIQLSSSGHLYNFICTFNDRDVIVG